MKNLLTNPTESDIIIRSPQERERAKGSESERGSKNFEKVWKTSWQKKQSVVEYKPCRTKPKGKSDKRSLKIEQQMRKYKAQESVKKNLNWKV